MLLVVVGMQHAFSKYSKNLVLFSRLSLNNRVLSPNFVLSSLHDGVLIVTILSFLTFRGKRSFSFLFLDDFHMFPLFFKLIAFISQRGFRVTEKFHGKYREFPYTPDIHNLSTINIPHQSGIFVIADESTLTHHYHPKSIVYIRVHSWCLHSVALDRCTMTRICHCTKYSCCAQHPPCSTYSVLPPSNPQQPLVFLLFPQRCLSQNAVQLDSLQYVTFPDGLSSLSNMH